MNISDREIHPAQTDKVQTAVIQTFTPVFSGALSTPTLLDLFVTQKGT